MSGSSDRRIEGLEEVIDRTTPRSLSKVEAGFLTLILLIATSLGDLSLYVKLDAFQRATVQLAQAQQTAKNELLERVLKEVKNGQAKTDAVGYQAVEIDRQTEALTRQATELAKQNAEMEHQNALVLAELKEITTQHTRDIKAARAQAEAANIAAKKARATSVQTQKTIATPWWKRH